jgi:hypothetical protein
MSLEYFRIPVNFDNDITATKGSSVFGNVTATNVLVNNLTGKFFGDGSNLNGASLPGQSAINTVVQTTSSNWNTAYNIGTAYQTISSLQSDINTVVQATSSNWNTAYNIGTAYQTASSFFSTNSLQTTLNYLSTNNIILSSVNVLNNLTVLGTLSAINTEFFNVSSYNVSTTTSVSSLEVSGDLMVTGNISAASLSAYHTHNPSDIYVANMLPYSQEGCLIGRPATNAGPAIEIPVGTGLRFELFGTPVPLGVNFADDGSAIDGKVVNASDKRLTVYSLFQNISSKLVRSDSTLETPTTGLSSVQNIVSLSQSTYDALTIKSPTTLYIIV